MWEALAELSYFFRLLCAKEIDPNQMDKLEKNIPVLICKLEKIFPPGFFDSMEHLMIHLPYQAKVGGPVKYHWIYTYERYVLFFMHSVHMVVVFPIWTLICYMAM